MDALRESTGYLGDPDRLVDAFNQDGYLFFRSVIDPEEVGNLRKDVIKILASYALVSESQTSEAIWTGKNLSEWLEVHARVHMLQSFDSLRNCPEVLCIIGTVAGASVLPWLNTDIRIQTPKSAPPTPVHQDYQCFYRAARFFVAWIPLVEIDASVGGISIAPGTHRTLTEKDYVISKDKYHTGTEGILVPEIPDEKCGQFLRSTYRPGDLLIMHDQVAHRSLPNTSSKIRLSIDIRYHRNDSFVPWYTQITNSEVERYVRRGNRALIQAGASQEQIQRIWWKLFWYEGGEVTEDRIRNEMRHENPPLFGSF